MSSWHYQLIRPQVLSVIPNPLVGEGWAFIISDRLFPRLRGTENSDRYGFNTGQISIRDIREVRNANLSTYAEILLLLTSDVATVTFLTIPFHSSGEIFSHYTPHHRSYVPSNLTIATRARGEAWPIFGVNLWVFLISRAFTPTGPPLSIQIRKQ